ncbi:hypothetical protein P168DRAFT_84400 [Aspergillus campestris IBT 28561]|uniref:Uncharacterized protein n=1 Tax=Aspergillus campestris (strain IBT 28561) TaxID=1392248 RepID=A0A2I1DAM1_ASPC2|nr:uncharacterized protein P168DRAFT_84400 [Aspergillus campestris IBT 28561]PKY06928.1 hypothetical protein P168DRAFT_84400 [Aspergillus campestris IBT 28561]
MQPQSRLIRWMEIFMRSKQCTILGRRELLVLSTPFFLSINPFFPLSIHLSAASSFAHVTCRFWHSSASQRRLQHCPTPSVAPSTPPQPNSS